MAQRCRYCGIKRFAVLMKETWLAWLYDNVGYKNLKKGKKKNAFAGTLKPMTRSESVDDLAGGKRLLIRLC